MTVKDENIENDLYFNVEHAPVEEYGLTGIPGRDHCVVVRPGVDDKIISLCSQDYELVPNDEIFPKIEQILGNDYQRTVRNYHDAQFSVDYKLKNESIDLPGGDTLIMLLNFQHSYDARRKFKGGCDAFREICANGLTVPFEGELADLFKLEMNGVHSHDNVIEVIHKFEDWLPQVIAKFKTAIKETYKPLYDTSVKDYSERILEVVTGTKVFSTKLVETAVAIAAKEEKIAKLPKTEWLAYNAINNLLFNDEVNKKPDFERRQLDLKVVNYMLSTI